MKKLFTERALLKVYLESRDLERLTAMARTNKAAVGEYVRNLILKHLAGPGDPASVPTVGLNKVCMHGWPLVSCQACRSEYALVRISDLPKAHSTSVGSEET